VTLPLKPSSASWRWHRVPEYGMVSSIEPREYGGNMDNKELTAGSTLHAAGAGAGACSRSATAMPCRATARCA
jgi:acetamidase/formamidase